MDMITIEKARDEAKRFIAAVHKLKMRVDHENRPEAKTWELYHGHIKQGPYLRCSKETGAIRRASMDLSRALSNLRK